MALLAELGASVDQGAGAIGLGLRLNVVRRLILGVQAEWNPWFDVLSGSAQVGAFNAFGIVGWRWVLVDHIDVHTSLEAGVSVLLFDAVGPYAGATGLRLGLAPVGVGIGLGERLRLEVQPEIVLAAPQLRGTPLVHHQYRISVSLAWSTIGP